MDQINVAGIEMDLEVQGEGPPLLYLHPEHYAHLHAPFLSKLSEDRKVYAARHPGFDGRRPPGDFRRVDDLAYLYLNLLDQLDLSNVMVLGASFGGWIGLEMAVRNTARISNLSLIAPLGVKLGGRDERDFADLAALPDDQAMSALFSGKGADLGSFSDAQLIEVAQDRQYLAYYAWKPYLHNPSLARWLQRIDVPVHLLWGEEDGYVTAAYARRLVDRVPDASLHMIPGAGHYPQIEKMDETLSAITAGLGG